MSETRTMIFKVSGIENETRVDVFLAQQNIGLSRSQIKRIIEEGHVLSENIPLKAKNKIKNGQTIKVIVPQPKKSVLKAEKIPLEIVYEDSSIIVINKPAGMVVHPGAGNHSGTLVNALLNHCNDLSGIGGVERPGIVHRLDKDTSGLLMVAKDDSSHQSLAKQLQDRDVLKKYIAIVSGVMKKNHGTIDKAIGRHVKDRKKMSTVTRMGREAISTYKVLKRYSLASLIEVILKTGRTHQIRVHLSAVGHPLLGDNIYGKKTTQVMKSLIHRQSLHSALLGFNHPKTEKYIEFSAPLPDDMQNLIDSLDKDQK